MSCTTRQAVRDAALSLGAVFDTIIGEVTEEIETGDIEIDYTAPSDVDHPPDDSPRPPTIVDSIIIWGGIHGEYAVSVVSKPKISGIFVDETITDKEKWVLIPFVGTDPNGTTNV